MTPATPVLETERLDPTLADPWFYGWRFVQRQNADGTVEEEQVPLTEEDVLHPLEDDFIVTNDLHFQILRYLNNVLSWHLANRPGALVFCDHRVDWQFPGIRAHGPDISVFFDSAPWDRMRGTYMMRDMGARPICVIEVTSPSTRNKDLTTKVSHYARIGIPLYVIIDLLEKDDAPDIHLLAYEPSPEGPLLTVNSGSNRVWLPGVDLWLVIDGERIVCLDPKGNPLGNYGEEVQRANHAEQEAQAAKERADQADERAEQADERAEQAAREAFTEKQRAADAKRDALTEKQSADDAKRDALTEKQRADAEKQRADAEKQRADAEKQRVEKALQDANDEKARANEAVLRLQEMEKELRRLRGESA